jgi:hypothetical protein
MGLAMNEDEQAEFNTLRRRLEVTARPGNTFAAGVLIGGAMAHPFGLNGYWIFGAAMIGGWFLNELERKASA